MKGVSFLTDDTHHKRYVQLDLTEVAHIGYEGLEDLIGTIMSEARKYDDDRTYFEDVSRQIEEEGF